MKIINEKDFVVYNNEILGVAKKVYGGYELIPLQFVGQTNRLETVITIDETTIDDITVIGQDAGKLLEHLSCQAESVIPAQQLLPF